MRYFRIISLFNSLLLSANVAAMPASGYHVLDKSTVKREVRESVSMHYGGSMPPIFLAHLKPRTAFYV